MRWFLSFAGIAVQTAAQNKASFVIGCFLVGTSATWFVPAVVLIPEMRILRIEKPVLPYTMVNFVGVIYARNEILFLKCQTQIREASSRLGLITDHET